jgi:hypothetical protein
MASKNISTLEGAQSMGIYEGKHCTLALTGQIPSQEEALDMACEAGGGNAMVDAVVYFKPANCPFDDQCYEVKGTVIKTRDMLKRSEIEDENPELADSDYIKETFSSPNGHKYLVYRKRSVVELDNDVKHYDLIVRVR